ncbi:low molecular weight phosphatase family protein [Nakamurella sp. YIM 132087]|uniref:Low molecular weight phosphatase family protein n=2 Tax=Nakamurella alba TaxID=2665158 RepID=A0A7K1FH16_9ACTN|nr:low molecular weight phosphatase family protein [Nakamurella alba]
MADFLMRAAIRDVPAASGWTVASAGTRTRGGREIHPLAGRVLAERGHDPAGFVSHGLEPVAVRDASLILTATRDHRSAVVKTVPAALGRTFTLLQFADLLTGQTPVEDGPALIAAAKAARGARPARTTEDDIADPVLLPVEDFRDCADEITAAINTLLAPLR